MHTSKNCSLLNFNTFGIDVQAKLLIEYDSVDELKSILQTGITTDQKTLHVGSGSNLLFLNNFDGIILHSRIREIQLLNETDKDVLVNVGAGVIWDEFVDYAVVHGWSGIENLSLIPGETGAAAVQNIGAYGVEVKDVIEEVYAIEIATGEEKVFTNAECEYDYRKSIFKTDLKGQYIITSVTFKLSKATSFKLGYQHLEEEVNKKGAVTLANIRQTIIEIREAKLPDPKKTGNAGSFFMNPVVKKEKYTQLSSQYPDMPHYYVSETEEKIPAAWLIDQCGWKGKQVGNAGVHDKQALVLVNKGNASGKEIADLSALIQKSVQDKFGIELHPEVNFIE